jgi:hypothetical protein
MSEHVSVSSHDGIDLSLHDVLELFGVGDVLYPRWKLRVPDEVVSSNDRASLGCLVEDLTLVIVLMTNKRGDIPNQRRSS